MEEKRGGLRKDRFLGGKLLSVLLKCWIRDTAFSKTTELHTTKSES